MAASSLMSRALDVVERALLLVLHCPREELGFSCAVAKRACLGFQSASRAMATVAAERPPAGGPNRRDADTAPLAASARSGFLRIVSWWQPHAEHLAVQLEDAVCLRPEDDMYRRGGLEALKDLIGATRMAAAHLSMTRPVADVNATCDATPEGQGAARQRVAPLLAGSVGAEAAAAEVEGTQAELALQLRAVELRRQANRHGAAGRRTQARAALEELLRVHQEQVAAAHAGRS